MRKLLALCLLSCSATLMASTITVNLPEFNGDWHGSGETFPLPAVVVGTFSYILPAGEDIVSATLNGQWGNSVVPNSAHNILKLDGIQVADTHAAFPDPYYNTVPWSYTFSDFTVLEDGSATLEAIQTSQYNIRLGVSTLTINTAPDGEVPEPGEWMLLGCGLLGTAGFYLRRRS